VRPTLATLSLCAALALGCARKPVYEYKTLDKTNEPRLETTEGRNAVMKEMTDQGWELTDPKMALPYHHQVWRREARR
jgi:hypothetical protein